MNETILPLPVDRLVEVVYQLDRDFDGVFEVPPSVEGARVKPVVYVPEEKLELVRKDELRELLLRAGAVYVKAPTVHVIRKRRRRDERHDVELDLEASLAIFAEETGADAAKVEFAAALAREADAGEVE